MTTKYKLTIIGTRGIPAKHGGFETFAEKLALHLVNKGWEVTVYCQEDSTGSRHQSTWNKVNLITIPVEGSGAASTIIFDWKVAISALKENGLILTLGYNTALFNILQRFNGQTNLINMDGIEWRRDKWGIIAKTWFWLNERAGCWIGNHLIADHPKIHDHLASRVSRSKITMIPYGGDEVLQADESLLEIYGLTKGNFSIIIARPEPENSILEMVRAFSKCKRNHHLVVLGNFDEKNQYHLKVSAAASSEVVFPGAIYEAPTIQSLRLFSRFYLHGHRVGGTNPSLVEALGAGCAVIAHDNHFNRWVAGPGAKYFRSEEDCSLLFDKLLMDDTSLNSMKKSSQLRFQENFTWEKVLAEYESLLAYWHPSN